MGEIAEDWQSYGDRSEKREIITSLGLRYELVTEYTAFVGVDVREAPADSAPMMARQVPNMKVKNSSSDGDVMPVMTPGGDWALTNMMSISRGGYDDDDSDSIERGGGQIYRGGGQRFASVSYPGDNIERGFGGNMKKKRTEGAWSGIMKMIGGMLSTGSNSDDMERGAETRCKTLPSNGSKRRTSKIKIDRKDETPKEIKSLKLDGTTKMEMEDHLPQLF